MTTLTLPPCPGLPRGAGDEPVFHEPWQAQAFAMAVELHAKGLFTWPEWAAALTEQLKSLPQPAGANEAESAAAYYRGWLDALESLVTSKGASTADELNRHASAWDRAAHRTMHGHPIVLEPQDFDR
jgi:nitrile hydratase accessory protein